MNGQKPWDKHYPDEIQLSYDYPKHNLAMFLQNAAETFADHIAVDFLGNKRTYKQVYTEARMFAQGLKALGIQRNDRVAIMLPNCPQGVIAYYGTLMAGAIVVQTNPLYTERELLHQMKDSGAKLIVALDLLFQRVKKVLPETDLAHMIVTSIQDALPFPKNLLYPLKLKKDGMQRNVEYSEHIYAWKKWLPQFPAIDEMADVDAENDLALLQYTGGTTGVSKGVMLTHHNLTVNTIQARKFLYKAQYGAERFLASLPFFHVYGMTTVMNLSMYMAGTMLLVPKFDIDMILQMIHKKRPTIFPGAPTMYISLINHPDIQKFDLSSINTCISGSAPLPVEVQEHFEELTGGRLVEGYGLTESSPVTHSNMLWAKRKIGSIGVPWPDTEAKIVDLETGQALEIGEIGELVVKGPQVMKGYWNRPEETNKTLKEGWLYTGDIGKMDEDGFFYIIDRKKDMIIAGGFNIYPREVEEVLFEHPKVLEASVIGVPDQYRGETVKAYIVLKEGESLTEDELNQWCRKRMAAFKAPKQYEFRDELPKSIIGKVLRRELKEELKAHTKEEQDHSEQTG